MINILHYQTLQTLTDNLQFKYIKKKLKIQLHLKLKGDIFYNF